MEPKDYWTERQRRIWAKQEKNEAKLVDKLTKLYDREATLLQKEIAQYYGKYGRDGVIEYRTLLQQLDPQDKTLLIERLDDFVAKYPQYAHLAPIRESIYKLDCLQGLEMSVRMQQLELGAIERERMEAHLIDAYEDGYLAIAEKLGPFMRVDRTAARALVNAAWFEGQGFSDRIWNNKEHLTKYLQNDFRSGIIRGDNYDKLARQMSMRFVDRSKADIKRLVITEGTYVANAAMIAPFEESGDYDGYEFVATLDSKTSGTCRGLDGMTFKLSERQVGVNFPPMHPNCRSTFLIVDVVADRGIDIDAQQASEGDSALEQFMPAKSVKEANRFAREVFGVQADYTGVDIRVANEWNEGLYNAKRDFPEIAERIRFVGTSQARNKGMRENVYRYYYEEAKRQGWAEAQAEFVAKKRTANTIGKVPADSLASSIADKNLASLPQGLREAIEPYRGVTINQSKFKNYESAIKNKQENVATKFHAEGTGSVKAIFDHEFGHQIDAYLRVADNSELVRKAFDERTRQQITDDLAEYAWNNENPDRYSEMIAEGWSEYQNNPEPREMATIVGREIERLWKLRNN